MFSKPICANKARIGPPSANQGISTDSHNSNHVQVTLQVTPPTSPCPTLSADTESAHKRACRDYLFCALRSVTSKKLTLGIKWLSTILMMVFTITQLSSSYRYFAAIFMPKYHARKRSDTCHCVPYQLITVWVSNGITNSN